jgi:hypothetical protein
VETDLARDPVSEDSPHRASWLLGFFWGSPQQLMSRRKWIILVALVTLLAVGGELLVRGWNTTKGCVQIVNQGDELMDDLAVSYTRTKVSLGPLAPGNSTRVWFSAAGRGTLKLDFKQKGNPLKGFEYSEFNPGQNHRDGFKLVLVVKNNLVERFMEDDESAAPERSWGERIKDLIMSAFETP